MAGYCRYKRLKKQVSYDSGATWQDVSPAEYMKGDLIEADSTICGYAVYTRWVESGYTCVGYDKHAVEYEQTSNDNINWTYTQRSRTGRLLEANSEDCGYVPPTPPTPTDYSTQYLTFRALEDGSELGLVTKENTPFYYSVDSGSTWHEMTSWSGGSKPYLTLDSGETIMYKGTFRPTNTLMYGFGSFKTYEGTFEVEGNIMSLKYGDNFSGQTALIEYADSYAFKGLFDGCTGLISAENLVLPATISGHCYQCYCDMFYGCSSLTTPPELPATTLSEECYLRMFQDCASLTTAPALPATTLADGCYDFMFRGCTSLTTAPELPATTLTDDCYSSMFRGCTSLTTAPELPATTLAEGCYFSMFKGCTSLTTAHVLSATTLANSCYMLMFDGCSSLSSITCLATDISAQNCTSQWLNKVSSTGAFLKASSMNDWPTGYDGIPNGWIVLNNS